jgi:hypothetical protein
MEAYSLIPLWNNKLDYKVLMKTRSKDKGMLKTTTGCCQTIMHALPTTTHAPRIRTWNGYAG